MIAHLVSLLQTDFVVGSNEWF